MQSSRVFANRYGRSHRRRRSNSNDSASFPETELADHIERLIRDHDPSVVFLGSDNVGRVVTPLTSVGVHVAAEESYDVFIVRHPAPSELDALEPHSEFYQETDSTQRE